MELSAWSIVSDDSLDNDISRLINSKLSRSLALVDLVLTPHPDSILEDMVKITGEQSVDVTIKWS